MKRDFQHIAAAKIKYRNRLSAKPNMFVQLCSIKPDIKQLIKNKTQFHSIYQFTVESIWCYLCIVLYIVAEVSNDV